MFVFNKPVRPVHTTWLHCSASDNAAHDDVSVMRAWHMEKGWSDCGYHFFIQKDGTVQVGRPIERIGAHVLGYNTGSIGICLHGLRESNFTSEQFDSLRDLCAQINAAYGLEMRFRGHNEVAAKACPVYDPIHVLDLDRLGYMRGTGVSRDAFAAGAVPANENSSDKDYPELSIGDRGEAVKRLQQLLNTCGGFMGIELEVDGIFGGQTGAAVRELKQEYDLYPSPVVMPHVWKTLIAADSRLLAKSA
ncbi:lysozyme [Roseibium album]|nr:lysozyme [Roseibium album]